MQRIIYVSVGVLVGLLFLSFVAACTTTEQAPTPEHCDAYLQRTVQAHLTAGGLVAGGNGEITPDGVVLSIQVVNTTTGKLHTEVVTDTETMAKRIKRAGLTATGTCERGGKVWQMFSGVQPIPSA